MRDNRYEHGPVRDWLSDICEPDAVRISLRDVLRKLNLPDPMAKQYMIGTGNLGLIFMHQAGCVLRIVEDRRFPLYRHPLIMRPIGSVRLTDSVRMDIQYSGTCPVNGPDLIPMHKDFIENGLEVGDLSSDNCCYLKTRSVKFPRGIPVIFDPLSIEPIFKTVQILKERLTKNLNHPRIFETRRRIVDFLPRTTEEPDEQDLLFADLRGNFKAMFAEATASADDISTGPQAVQAFWASMIEATKQGRLIPSWMNKRRRSQPAHKDIDDISRAYAVHLAKYNPLFADCAR